MKLRRPNLEAIYREVDHYIPKKENLQPPRIGNLCTGGTESWRCSGSDPGHYGYRSVDGNSERVGRAGHERWWRYQPALHAGRTNSRLAGCRYLPG